jgi:hypothetical protein
MRFTFARVVRSFHAEREYVMQGRCALLAACAVFGLLVIGAATAASTPKPQTLSFLEVNTTFAGIGGFNAAGNSPPVAGQGFTFASTLFKWAGTKKGAPLGHDQVVCLVTYVDLSVGSVRLQCSATVFLPGGAIQLAGSSNFANPVTNVAVVGGTGAYAGAQGTARITSIGGQDSNASAYILRITN